MIPTPDQNETDLTKCLRILLGKQDMVEVCYLIKYFKLLRSFLFKELVNTLMVLAVHCKVSDCGHQPMVVHMHWHQLFIVRGVGLPQLQTDFSFHFSSKSTLYSCIFYESFCMENLKSNR